MIATLVSEIWMWVEPQGNDRIALLQIHLRSGLVRKIMIAGQTSWEGGGATNPTLVRSFVYAASKDFDHRNLGIDLRRGKGSLAGFFDSEIQRDVITLSGGREENLLTL